MFKFIRNLFTDGGTQVKEIKDMTARIETTTYGAALKAAKTGLIIATYSRARDARRGAARRGLTLV